MWKRTHCCNARCAAASSKTGRSSLSRTVSIPLSILIESWCSTRAGWSSSTRPRSSSSAKAGFTSWSKRPDSLTTATGLELRNNPSAYDEHGASWVAGKDKIACLVSGRSLAPQHDSLGCGYEGAYPLDNRLGLVCTSYIDRAIVRALHGGP